MAVPDHYASPISTRSKVVLEIASEIITRHNPNWQARIFFKDQTEEKWATSFYASSTIEGIESVVKGESTMAIINPAAVGALAVRGIRPFTKPQPIRSLVTLPTNDQFVFAVHAKTGLKTLEEIAQKRYPLRLSVRGIPDHSVHVMLDHIMAAAGFTTADLIAWGGAVIKEGSIPWKGTKKLNDLIAGERIDAVFDEAVEAWLPEAVEGGITVLPISEETVRKVEALGFRRAYLHKDRFPMLKQDILTVDFSGWPVFVREDAPDDLVRHMCEGLDARHAAIPWEGKGPLPVERLCIEAADTPQDVPLHPAAERYWRERGYLR